MRISEASTLFKIHGDRVTVRSNGTEYHEAIEDFEADNGGPAPGVPGNFKPGFVPIGALYVPPATLEPEQAPIVRVSNGRSTARVVGDWPEAAAIIAKLQDLLDAKSVRENPPEPEPEEPTDEFKRLLEAANLRKLAFERMMARRANDADASQEEKDYQEFLRNNPDVRPRVARNP